MDINIDEILIKINEIDGWLSSEEQKALFYLPQQIDHIEGSIVEIGSFKGKSTIALGLGSKMLTKKKRPIYTIDPFKSHYDGPKYPDFKTFNYDYFDFFWQNVEKFKLQNYVKPIKKFSTEAYNDCPHTIAAIFIDGDHRYKSVKHDIIHYSSRIVKGGLIVFHDYGNANIPGVRKAVDELICEKKFKLISTHDSLRIFQKIK